MDIQNKQVGNLVPVSCIKCSHGEILAKSHKGSLVSTPTGKNCVEYLCPKCNANWCQSSLSDEFFLKAIEIALEKKCNPGFSDNIESIVNKMVSIRNSGGQLIDFFSKLANSIEEALNSLGVTTSSKEVIDTLTTFIFSHINMTKEMKYLAKVRRRENKSHRL